MTFIEWKLFHYKRGSLIVYEDSHSILLSRNRDEFYWRESLPWYENEFDFYKMLSINFIVSIHHDIYWIEALPQ
jgi:hypothetical protein